MDAHCQHEEMASTILLTGATSGLGRATAAELSDAGHTVLVHGRDQGKVDDVVGELGGDARGYVADLSSLDEARRLADEVTANEQVLDVLVNNAGLVTPERETSQDGIELTFAVNYVAPWLLTGRLLGLLERSAPARIVNVASIGQAPVDWDDPQLERGFEPYRAYAQSKLAQISYTFELAERLDGSGVTVTALHPATLMDTQMVRGSFGRSMTTVEDGVPPVVRLATDPALDGVSGRFFNQTQEARADDQAYDEQARKRLWDLSAELAGEDPYA
jgi:NAD(P)-dependent dehydrogenase (short-subunit alcohol dehydrogenase family)